MASDPLKRVRLSEAKEIYNKWTDLSCSLEFVMSLPDSKATPKLIGAVITKMLSKYTHSVIRTEVANLIKHWRTEQGHPEIMEHIDWMRAMFGVTSS